MGNIGATEILLIALVALLLFGAGRIADIGKGLGQGIRNFKEGLKEIEDDKGAKKETEKKLPAPTEAEKVRPQEQAGSSGASGGQDERAHAEKAGKAS
jgi:sec-independent protein translocase protein TatA